MPKYHNIEPKRWFGREHYVAYSEVGLWHVKRVRKERWEARLSRSYYDSSNVWYITGKTMASISKQLEEMKNV